MAHRLEKQALQRANSAVILTLVGGGLVVCALAAIVYDVGRMIAGW